VNARFRDWDEGTLDLAIERFTVGLDGDAEALLARRADPGELDELERAVAAVHLGLLADLEAPPASFVERLERQGREVVGRPDRTARPERGRERRRDLRAWTRTVAGAGWLVAAGLLLFFLLRGEGVEAPPARRAALIADASDLVRADWTVTDDPGAAGAGGDVVWSTARQEGYMRFEGLAPNDPARNQYQLWIFDPTRADWEARPVDGGVFDVPGGGEVVVPIDPKLAVGETALFAVTLEVPGGVVVSDRERLVLTASPSG
jgi:hypothetical protein